MTVKLEFVAEHDAFAKIAGLSPCAGKTLVQLFC
jgi:hypothetical protein